MNSKSAPTIRVLFLAPFLAHSLFAADDYKLGPDSLPQEDVPRGEVTKYRWSSKIFPGTERDYWVYVPKQYEAAKPDRKSTRLNSSHSQISYAVFCLKKKKKKIKKSKKTQANIS